MRRFLLLVVAFALAACGGGRAPEWRVNAHDALHAATLAWLNARPRVELAEVARMRAEIGRSGRPDILAQAELALCAARVAALSFEPCTAYEGLSPHATAGQKSYAALLETRWAAVDPAQLPAPYRGLEDGRVNAQRLAAIADPLSRLIAAAVALRSERIEADAILLAVETASDEGWRRPLLAWLKVALKVAREGGQNDLARRLEGRIALAGGNAGATPEASSAPLNFQNE